MARSKRAVKHSNAGGEPVAQSAFQGKGKLREIPNSATICRAALVAWRRPLAWSGHLYTHKAMDPLAESVPLRMTLHDRLQRVPSSKAQIYQIKSFASPDLCRDLIALIDKDHRPSTIADHNGDHYFRTSETCDLAASEPAAARIEKS